MNNRAGWRAGMVGLALAWPAADAEAGATYSVSVVAGPTGGTGTKATGINDLGQVIGTASVVPSGAIDGGGMQVVAGQSVSAANVGFVSSGGQVSTIAAGLGLPTAINQSGQVVGWNPSAPYGSGVFAQDGLSASVGPKGEDGVPLAINDYGLFVGSAGGVPYVETPHGQRVAIPTGTAVGAAVAINDAGQVVLDLHQPTSAGSRGFVLNNGTLSDLGTLGGNYATATAINAAGDVVGTSSIAGGSGNEHAFAWSGGKMFDLGTLGGATSQALAINSSGVIVGSSDLASGSSPHAFLQKGGAMTDLNALIPVGSGWTLTSATGINDLGQVAADGRNAGGQAAAFLLTPSNLNGPSLMSMSRAPAAETVPEPSTLGAFAAIGGGLWLRLRGRSRGLAPGDSR